MNITLALVGSRAFTDYARFEAGVAEALRDWGEPLVDEVVTGDARGADALAARWAREHACPVRVLTAAWRTHGRGAGVMRNTDIVRACTHMVAFPAPDGRGTQDSIAKARARGKRVRVFAVAAAAAAATAPM